MPSTDLLLIRHGETDWNRQHRFQGQLDVPLNALGQTQAARLAERLMDEPIDALVCSDLARAQATAAPLVQQRGLTLRSDSGWREQSFGVLEGLTVPTIRTEHPELWAQWIRHAADYALPGGESPRQFHTRVLAALQAVAEAHAGQRVMVVTHGGVLDMLWRTVHGLSLDGPRACAIPNAGLNRLRWHAGGALELLVWADDAHLQGLPSQPSTVPASVAAGVAGIRPA
ncbi:MAG: histidine phosphatase family protein [Leptothrix sp. (in: b-proteobacteria)]